MRISPRVRDLCRNPLARLSACLTVGLVGLSAFAEGGSPTFSIDTTAAQSAVTELKTKISEFITNDLMVAMLVVLGAGVGVWLIFLAWGKFKKAGSKAG